MTSSYADLYSQKYNIDWSSYFSGQLTLIPHVLNDDESENIYVIGTTADSTGMATVGSHK